MARQKIKGSKHGSGANSHRTDRRRNRYKRNLRDRAARGDMKARRMVDHPRQRHRPRHSVVEQAPRYMQVRAVDNYVHDEHGMRTHKVKTVPANAKFKNKSVFVQQKVA